MKFSLKYDRQQLARHLGRVELYATLQQSSANEEASLLSGRIEQGVRQKSGSSLLARTRNNVEKGVRRELAVWHNGFKSSRISDSASQANSQAKTKPTGSPIDQYAEQMLRILLVGGLAP
ncbi:hypothetical protein DL768_007157 [Monosporascus sp. mg162]|nr:hypothetical protein DL768_007157 [Monosporascus sp. mg162]